MRAIELARRAALGTARWAGRQGIAVEAALGTEQHAAAWYAAARWLGEPVSGGLKRAYDRCRDQ